jgi:hypothetical protein
MPISPAARTNWFSTAARSFSTRSGTLCCQLAQFEEALGIVDFVDGEPQPGTIVPAAPCLEAEVYQALVLGVRDYLGKNGFPGRDHRSLGGH